MKFIFAIFSLICFILSHKSLAIGSNSFNPRLGFSNINCIIHCVQPVGQESEEDTIQVRNIISNYGKLYDCLKKCNQ